MENNEFEKECCTCADEPQEDVGICPRCKSHNTVSGGMSRHEPRRVWLCCEDCKFRYEVYLEGPKHGQKTGVTDDSRCV